MWLKNPTLEEVQDFDVTDKRAIAIFIDPARPQDATSQEICVRKRRLPFDQASAVTTVRSRTSPQGPSVHIVSTHTSYGKMQ